MKKINWDSEIKANFSELSEEDYMSTEGGISVWDGIGVFLDVFEWLLDASTITVDAPTIPQVPTVC